MNIETLTVAVILVLATMAVLFVLVAASRRDRALTCWAIGMAGTALGVLLMFGNLGQVVPPHWLGNILVLTFHFSLPLGMRFFVQRSRAWPTRFTIYLVAVVVLSLWFDLVWPIRAIRGLVISVAMILFTFEFLRLLRDLKLYVRPLVRRAMTLLGSAYIVTFVARAALYWVPITSKIPQEESLMTLATLWATLVFTILWAGMSLLLDAGRLQAAVVARAEELRRLNALKDRVLAMTSHDLRGPLGNLRLLWQEMGQQLTQGKCIDVDQSLVASVDRSLAGTQSLLENLFSFAESQQAAHPGASVCDLGLAIEAVIDQWGPLAAGKEIELKVGSMVPQEVAAEYGAVVTVLRNLVGNAVKFTPSGGTVTVEVLVDGDRGTSVEVRDTGIGMDPEALPQQLELRSRKSRPGTAGERGSGFGLVLVHEMVASWNGSLSFHSEPGTGTVVRVGFLSIT